MAASSTNQFAVVTGASSGIGYELAKQFAENGFDLLIVSAGERIHDTAQEFQTPGTRVQAVQADLATHEGVHELLDAIQSSGRPVDAVAINAGVGVSGRFAE
ncbi:MAG: SDR family NAD(P)-dependent oxidoreductase, partial [Acidobacteriaceae bacterium]|nr:SDR family NAD(P)-dependent oxidoreductase [Acidobacteriaceae bacterium]